MVKSNINVPYPLERVRERLRVRLLLLLVIALSCGNAVAQKKVTTATVQKRPTTAATAQKKKLKNAAITDKAAEHLSDEKVAQMVNATQKIMFVDSLVVSKTDFLSNFMLNPEAGKIGKYNEMFKTDEQPNAIAHVNELGDKAYFSVEDSIGNFHLFTSTLIDGKPTNAEPLPGIDSNGKYIDANYPFMMADGITLYFAAKGKESVGGYDIFVTRYDSEQKTFLKPENIGMPFNSPGNDYMYAIDEYGNIGWFVTDRGQQAGNVCIYMFIPSTVRETYPTEKYTEKQMKDLASLHSIADTWTDIEERDNALKRIKAIPQRLNSQTNKPSFTFIVNDDVTYYWYRDFKVKDNIKKFRRLQEQKRRLTILENSLEKAREAYANASNEERQTMRSEILQSEQQYYAYERDTENLEKQIRNSENKAIDK